jgi:hypothetical protein
VDASVMVQNTPRFFLPSAPMVQNTPIKMVDMFPFCVVFGVLFDGSTAVGT